MVAQGCQESTLDQNAKNSVGRDGSHAAKNARPGCLHSPREEAAKEGVNADMWIDNVELIAAAGIGMETITYVVNIYKYYIAYKLGCGARRGTQSKRSSGKMLVRGGCHTTNAGGRGWFRR
jgi:hypothetical protein